MAEIILVGATPPPLPALTDKELAVIEKFSHDKKKLKDVRRRVAKLASHAIYDTQILPDAAKEILESLVTSFRLEIDGLKFSNPKELDIIPSAFLRAIGTVPTLNRFIAMGFGVTDERFNDSIRHEYSYNNLSIFEYILDEFLHQVDVKLRIIAPPTVSEVTNVINYGKFSDDFTKMSLKKPNFSFISTENEYDIAIQGLANIKIEFVDEFVELVQKFNINSLTDIKHEGKWSLAYIIRSKFQTSYEKMLSFNYHNRANKFLDQWDRQKFLKNLDNLYDSDLYISLKDKLLKLLIDGSLPNKLTDDNGNDGLYSDEGANSLESRLSILDQFTALNPGAPVSGKILELFPELVQALEIPRVTAPETPPAIWPNDRIAIKGVLESPPDFIKRNYAEWLGKGLTRADVRRLDKPLSTALDNWLRRNPMPDDLDLPTLKEQNSRWVEKIEKEGFGTVVSANVSGASAGEVLKVAQRLRAAQYRHRQSAK